MEPTEPHASNSSQSSLPEPAPAFIDAFTAQAPPPVIAAAPNPPLDVPALTAPETFPSQPTVEIPAHRTLFGWVMPSLVFRFSCVAAMALAFASVVSAAPACTDRSVDDTKKDASAAIDATKAGASGTATCRTAPAPGGSTR